MTFAGEAELKGHQKTRSSPVTMVWYGCKSAEWNQNGTQPCNQSTRACVLGLMLRAVTGECCVPSCPKTTLMVLDSVWWDPLSRFWPGGEHNRCVNAGVWHCHEAMCQCSAEGAWQNIQMNFRSSAFPSRALRCESIRVFPLHLAQILMLSLINVNETPR